MKANFLRFSFLLLLLGAFDSMAQEAVTAAPNPEALFTSPDKTLHTNKQAAYHIMKDLLEANHWELADRYIDETYIQHNPNAANGRKAVVDFFTNVLKVQPSPIPDKMKTKIVSVMAEGDLVSVATVRVEKDAKDPSKTYTTTWFDQWRFRNGKAVEHWDCALKMN
ncbi:Predicted SnoaL-like aldol condensation-catalyzing enzyme [Flexibacter flexilis DSM 6793]|uniref:Predicted SnoaL-like aldol condensation-catalyzing enzyme n=1 Tax=Flexibacter flexilis DSM 6793 TaxID=927664 RepID=A0A1I1HL75_9BACT|nr:nuclear transport factor 2 family protein [Flexibacter flexilis]SFC24827.1 Predicted SnoaL-like aldol condensation-catalyzing enzyme [Flexibacter flexilis DSM 6793]